MSGNPQDFQKFSGFVGAIVDRKIRAVAIGITSSTGYFKTLIAQAAASATASQTSAAAASTSAGNADGSASQAALIYNSFTANYLGIQASDPQRTSTGQIPNRGAFYIRSTDNHLRIAVAVASGVVTWSDATVAADPNSLIVNGDQFLSRVANASTPQAVAGKVTFNNTITAPRVTDWATQQVATAVDVKSLTDAISTSLAAETTRATARENAIAATVTAETNRATGIENGLRTDLTAETSRATARENVVEVKVNDEKTRAQNAESSLGTAISTETTRAQTAESSIAATVTAETNRATAAEGQLRTDLTAETSRATAKENLVDGRVTAEVTRAQNAEGALGTAVSAETTRAQGAESTLDGKITTERNRALGIEGGLRTDLTAESSRAQTSENNLGNAISSEVTRATGIEGGLRTDLSALIAKFTSGGNANGTWERRPNILEQEGYIEYPSGAEPTLVVVLPVPHGSTNYHIVLTPVIDAPSDIRDTWVEAVKNSIQVGQFQVQYQHGRDGSSGDKPYLTGFYWRTKEYTNLTYTGTTVPGGTPPPPPPPPTPDQPGPGDPVGCVATSAYLQNNTPAGMAHVGDALWILDDDGNGYHDGFIHALDFSPQHCWQIETASGITLTASDSTPVTLRDGTSVNIRQIVGHEVAVSDNGDFHWENVVALHDMGIHNVALLNAGNSTYAAGDQANRFIFTHNINQNKNL